eukprot:TRINITY_DN32125_c0_g1_i1.p1 TRINITY_DN32125_c0_g1~~TRINITY_DN32125_c0_g1_i1.p1  ORF type:complete len:226 (-),score=40.64 TRINITY_DN32125_c0_g1_i1:407-1084(-)
MLQKKLEFLVQSLIQNKDSVQFRMPVDYEQLGLWDYPLKIKNPMDLNTVQQNIRQSKYKTTDQFLQDVNLIWNNCKVYNLEGSQIYRQAERMEKFTKQLIKNLGKSNKNKSKKKIKENKKQQSREEIQSDNQSQQHENQIQIISSSKLKKEHSDINQKLQIAQNFKKFTSLQLVQMLKIIVENNTDMLSLSNQKEHSNEIKINLGFADSNTAQQILNIVSDKDKQ